MSKLSRQEIEHGKDEKDSSRKVESIADLTFGEYLRLLQNPDIWAKVALAIDRKIFCDSLEEIRLIRNNIMHFDPDGLDDESKESLRNFVRLLQTLRDMSVF